MRVLGIDPGLNITGYGLVEVCAEGQKLIEAGEIKRLFELYNGLEDVTKDLLPDVLAVEELYSHYNHPRTAVIMGHARGVLFLVAGKADIPVFSYSATRVKKSLTGRGHASKEQVAKMISSILKSGEIDGHPDITDAVAVALCHINAVSHGDVS